MNIRVLSLVAGLLVVGSMLLVGCDKSDEPIDTTPIETTVNTTAPSEETSDPEVTTTEAEETTIEDEVTTTEPEETTTEPEETTTEPDTTPLPQPETIAASPVKNFRYKGHITSINGVAYDLNGYRDMVADPKVHVIAQQNGIVLGANNRLYLSGWAAMNGGQKGIYWSIDGTNWFSFVGGSYANATEEIKTEAGNQESAWMLTNVVDANVVFADVAADLSAYAGQTVTVQVAVGGTTNGLCHFLTLEVTVGGGSAGDNDVAGLPTLNGQTPYEAYESVREQVDGMLTNCQENNTTNQYLSYMGQTALMQTVESVSKINGNDLESITTTVSYLDSTTSVTKSYYKDGWLYGNENGTTFKAQLTMEQMYAIVYGTDAANEEKILNMPESWFKDVGFTQNEDGTYSIRVLLEGDRVEEVIGRLGIADMAAMGMELSDLCYDIVLDAEGNFLKIVYTFRLTMDLEGEAMVIESESTITYTGIGSTTVTVPDGCDGYVDVTDQLVNSIA